MGNGDGNMVGWRWGQPRPRHGSGPVASWGSGGIGFTKVEMAIGRRVRHHRRAFFKVRWQRRHRRRKVVEAVSSKERMKVAAERREETLCHFLQARVSEEKEGVEGNSSKKGMNIAAEERGGGGVVEEGMESPTGRMEGWWRLWVREGRK